MLLNKPLWQTEEIELAERELNDFSTPLPFEPSHSAL
jgi:hypothetical protein